MAASGSSNVGAGCPGCNIANDSIPNFFLNCNSPTRASRAAAVARSLHIIARVQLCLLGGLTPREFLRRHWQKRPLFVRGALPQLRNLLEVAELAALASRDDVESRIVVRRGRRRETSHGPFARMRARPRDWTLLVSGVNLHVRAADELLRRFAFVPQARLDDVMVSYATPGGGVGPHVDSYDVFLLQGPGRRRWRISPPHDGNRPRKGERFIVNPGD